MIKKKNAKKKVAPNGLTFYKDNKGKFRVRIYKKGHIIFGSTQGYSTQANALKNLLSIAKLIPKYLKDYEKSN